MPKSVAEFMVDVVLFELNSLYKTGTLKHDVPVVYARLIEVVHDELAYWGCNP